jgi:Glycine-rich domain
VATTLQSQAFIGAGTYSFSIPTGVSSVWVTMIGAGGGSGGCIVNSAGATGGGGGGSAEFCHRTPLDVQSTNAYVSGGAITVVVGAKGSAGSTLGTSGGIGGSSSVGPLVCNGGTGGTTAGSGLQGGGGGVGGAPANLVSNIANSAIGIYEGFYFTGGGSGGSGSFSGGRTGAPSINFTAQAPNANGGGTGASSPYGMGAINGTAPRSAGVNAPSTSYGAGGGGSTISFTGPFPALIGGTGADGYVLIEWVGQ